MILNYLAGGSAMRVALIVVLPMLTAAVGGVSEYAQNAPTNAPATMVGAQSRDSFKECSDCPEMIVVPAGTFRMGAAAGEKGRPADGREEPQHEVAIKRPFAMG